MESVTVTVDVGTSKVFVVVAVQRQAEWEVLGAVSVPCFGIKKGVVVNIETTIEAIDQAISRIEKQLSLKIEAFFITVGGGSVEGINSAGVVAVSGKDNEIQGKDIQRVIEAARAIKIPLDREMLHVLPQEFRVDQVSHIKNPLNMIGVRLEVNVHIITGNTPATRNLISSANRAGFEVQGVGFGALMASYSAISLEEKNMGVIHLDLGAGTTDVLVFFEGACHHTNVLPVGGERVTLDIAQVWKIGEEEAEAVKREYGHAFLDTLSSAEEEILIRGVGTRSAEGKSSYELCQIIESRLREIFDLVLNELEKKGLLQKIYGGVVLTGGGALLSGVVELCESIFQLPVRVGFPSRFVGLEEEFISCEYAAGLGLLVYSEGEMVARSKVPRKIRSKKTGHPSWKRLFAWLKNWV